MSAPSPKTVAGAVVSFAITVDGKTLDDSVDVLAIDVWTGIDAIPRARLVLRDGAPDWPGFPLSDGQTFVPGRKVGISLGYDGNNGEVFEGVLVSQRLELDAMHGSRLIVDIHHPAARMTLARGNAVFEKLSDADLMAKLIRANGLNARVDATKLTHEAIVQYDASDWALLCRRARRNGMVVIPEIGAVRVAVPNTRQSPVHNLGYGDNILDLDLALDASGQFAAQAIRSASWDPAIQKRRESGPDAVAVTEPGNLSAEQLAKVFNVARADQETGAPLDDTALMGWSSATLLRSRLRKIHGRVSFPGSSRVAPDTTVELSELGQRFNGRAWVGAVHHHVADGNWVTGIEVGLPPEPAADAVGTDSPGAVTTPAAGLMPPIEGLQTGIVRQIAKDPQHAYRVRLSLPLLGDDTHSVWARVANIAASNKTGALFYPEVGDEVVVGFMNQDPRFPVILGSLYGKTRPPAWAPDDKNSQKGLRTAGQLELRFDDKDKAIEIRTPSNQSVRLDDKRGELTLVDRYKNKITLSRGGIDIESSGNLTLKAKGSLKFEANGNLAARAAGALTAEGLQVAMQARGTFTATGVGNAELSSSGLVNLRGARVKVEERRADPDEDA